jgi:hypothetical protein
MIPIKIQCACGQRYAFEVEAVGGRMPSAVACPVCGADGTGAANAVIAQSMPPPAPVAIDGTHARTAAPAPSVRLAATAAPGHAAPRGSVSNLPRTDRTQSEQEARAKVSWGDPPEAVTSFLMIQGFGYEEASALVQSMFKERAATIRRNGFKKLAVGIALMCVPLVALAIFTSLGFILLKLFAITIMIGVWGAWKFLKALFMILAPKSEPGDVAEQ